MFNFNQSKESDKHLYLTSLCERMGRIIVHIVNSNRIMSVKMIDYLKENHALKLEIQQLYRQIANSSGSDNPSQYSRFQDIKTVETTIQELEKYFQTNYTDGLTKELKDINDFFKDQVEKR